MPKNLARITLLCLAAALVAVPTFGAAEVAPHIPAEKADSGVRVAAMADLHARLSGLEGAEKASAFEVRMPAERLAALAAQVPGSGPLWVGVHGEVGFAYDPSLKSQAVGRVKVADGMTVWSGAFRSPGAHGVRLQLESVNLPKGAELYVFGRHGHAFGPYVGRQAELWTNTVAGDEIVLQLHMPTNHMPPTWDRDARGGQLFRVAQLSHLGDRYELGFSAEKAFCSWNDSCIVNAECASIPSAVQVA
ncbi:MAG: hypothetical protein MI919_00855, partial [Holophagales bacterium]|nr:hypothetical protein [Holophagales bacterium]